MSSPEPELPESRALCCPFCGSDQIALRRRGPGGAGMTKVEQWCTACERKFFWFIQGSQPLGELFPPPSLGAE
jgi:hypothetical protein